MSLFQWLQDDALANIELRWPGMQQDCPVVVDPQPTQVVDTPGAAYGKSLGGSAGGTFRPRGPTDPVSVPGLPDVPPAVYHPDPHDPQSGGHPSGRTGSSATPNWTADRVPHRIIEPFANGWAVGAGDRQSPEIAASGGMNSALIAQRIRQGGGIPSVEMCQAPPTMAANLASHTVTVQRRSGNTFSPIPVDGLVAPGEAIRYALSGANLPFDLVTFRVLDFEMGSVVFEFVTSTNALLSAWVDTVAPLLEGAYRLTAEVRNAPFLTFTHFDDTTFQVNISAPPPPDEPPVGGGGLLGDVKGIIIALAVLVGIVIVAPTLTRIGRG